MKIGETIRLNGVMLEAIAEISKEYCCKGCYFAKSNKCPEDDDKNLLCIKDDIIIFKKKKIMVRKIGEQFKYEGVTLEVAEAPKGNPCGDCYFLLNENKCLESFIKIGRCYGKYRTDKREVFFKEVKK